MPHRIVHMLRARGTGRRPVMLAIAGDSAAGKTTLTRGLVECLGEDRMTAVCVDDYHRFDRRERRGKPFTALHPDCNYVEIMEHVRHKRPEVMRGYVRRERLGTSSPAGRVGL